MSGAVFDGRIAQLVEQLTLNQRVLGSSPSAPTIKNPRLVRGFFVCGFRRAALFRWGAVSAHSDPQRLFGPA